MVLLSDPATTDETHQPVFLPFLTPPNQRRTLSHSLRTTQSLLSLGSTAPGRETHLRAAGQRHQSLVHRNRTVSKSLEASTRRHDLRPAAVWTHPSAAPSSTAQPGRAAIAGSGRLLGTLIPQSLDHLLSSCKYAATLSISAKGSVDSLLLLSRFVEATYITYTFLSPTPTVRDIGHKPTHNGQGGPSFTMR